MREVHADKIANAVAALCAEANRTLPPDMERAVRAAADTEPWPLAKATLGTLCRNLDAARETGLPICQDTGMACVFLELGQEIHQQL